MSGHPEAGRHNWLVHRILWEELSRAVRRYARGVLIDVGCGVKPYEELTRGVVEQHIGVDHPLTGHDRSRVDVVGSVHATTLPSEEADTVLCTFLLEHVERPEEALREMRRILRPGGHLILAAPLFWHLHEEPRDFFRYTRHGLEHLLTAAGFEIVEMKPLSGFLVTFSQEACYYLERRRRGMLKPFVAVAQAVFQRAAWVLRRMGRDNALEFTWAYLAVARRS